MIDPCQKGKCLLYPKCVNDKKLTILAACPIFVSYINAYIREEIIKEPEPAEYFQLSLLQVSYLWTYIKSIFPNLDDKEYMRLKWDYGHYERSL